MTLYTRTAHIIATTLTDVEGIEAKAAVAEVAKGLADVFKEHDRTGFEYGRFFAACRLSPWGELLLPGNPVNGDGRN